MALPSAAIMGAFQPIMRSPSSWSCDNKGRFCLQALLMLVQCLLNQLCAKEYISRQQCEEFMRDAHSTAESAQQICDKNCRVQEEVC